MRYFVVNLIAISALITFAVWWHSTAWDDCMTAHSFEFCYRSVFQ